MSDTLLAPQTEAQAEQALWREYQEAWLRYQTSKADEDRAAAERVYARWFDVFMGHV